MVQALAVRWVALTVSLSIVGNVIGADPDADSASIPPPVNVSSSRPAEDAAIVRRLAEFASADFHDAPLTSLIPFLRGHRIDAILDYKALEDGAVELDAPALNLQASWISLRSLLRLVLDRADMTYVVSDGKLLITTKDKADASLTVKVYRVHDLVRVANGPNVGQDDYDTLIEMLTSTVRPQFWDEVGGPGSMSPYQGTLVIDQTQPVHEEIELVLAALRQGRARQKRDNAFSPIFIEGPAQTAVRRKLAEKSNMFGDFQFAGTRLDEAMVRVAAAYDLPIQLDQKALEDAGEGTDTPVTGDLRHVSPQVALKLLLEPLDLTYIVVDEVILVTTKDRADAELVAVVYPVGDLVGHPDPPPAGGGSSQDFDSLMETIANTVRPQSWDEVGGPGSMSPFSATSSLVISQTGEVHEQIIRLLAGLRQLRAPARLRQAKNAPTPAVDRNGGELMTKLYSLDANLDPDDVVQTVRQINPQSWSRPECSIRVAGRQLIARNTRDVHRQIAAWLRHPTRPDLAGSGGF